MSSNKFFTWHPSRSKAPPTPAEKGPSKAKRKPIPLEFARIPDPNNASRTRRTTDSIALQDAAVQSATSLLAVMNDCLNTHMLSTQQSSGGLKPVHGQGRPRSHTAPSTPLAEAPPMPLAELEGSTPLQSSSYNSRQSMDSSAIHAAISSPKVPDGYSIGRPHSSPQEAQYKLPVYARQSYQTPARGASTFPPLDIIPRARTGSPLRSRRPSHQSTTVINLSDDTLVPSEIDYDPYSGRRPSFGQTSQPQELASSASESQHYSRSNSTQNVPPVPPQWLTLPTPPASDPCMDVESALMDQIAAMRASHDAHIAALKESHGREIASHQAYIAILEKRRVAQQISNPTSRQNLTIDTKSTTRDVGLLSSDASATASMQSFELSLEQHKRASSEAAAETEALKRKLSLARKAQAEHGDVRRERDHLREICERNDRRISQLKDIVRKAKENEKSLRNAMGSLDAALVTSNNERTDVLEGFYEACEQLRRVSRREKLLAAERDEMHEQLCRLDADRAHSRSAIKALEGAIDEHEAVLKRRNTLRNDPLIQQLDGLRHALAEKEAPIRQLEEAAVSPAQVAQPEHVAEDRLDEAHKLDEELRICRQHLDAAKADRDRYNTLLHAELRRQSKSAVAKGHLGTPTIGDEASIAFTQRLKSMSISATDQSNSQDSGGEDLQARVALLEAELKHCTKEIILYKLDIKGYKKDLKAANAENEALRVSRHRRTSTATNKKNKDDTRTTQIEAPSTDLTSGLGISYPCTPCTPKRTVASATSSALLSTTPLPDLPLAPLSPPSSRPKTPLGVHKKLPKPPPQSASPNLPQPLTPPRTNMQRQETLRSLSESIISSYAKRTPEQSITEITPPRGRSSDPSRAYDFQGRSAVPIKIARHTSELLNVAPQNNAAWSG